MTEHYSSRGSGPLPGYPRPSGGRPGEAPVTTEFVSERLAECMRELREVRYRKATHLMRRIEAFDSGTFAHCVRVSELAFRLGETLGLPRREVRLLERAALFHDAGKLCVPRKVLDKDGRLNGREWRIIREHASAGESICLEATRDTEIAALVRQHHERLDGSGYPDRLHAARISMPVRTLQMADIFDALTSARAYKPAYSVRQALDIIDGEVAAGWRDRRVAEALREVVG